MNEHVVWDAFKIKKLRARYGETRAQFALRLRLCVGTIRNWEQGLGLPIGPAQVVLDRLEQDLDAKIRELQSA